MSMKAGSHAGLRFLADRLREPCSGNTLMCKL